MAEYIEREELLRRIDMVTDTVGFPGHLAIKQLVSRVPAADVAPVRHGRWIIRNIVTISQRGRAIKSRLFICSRCERSNGRAPKPYCPHCGAKMDLE